jgi:hypothetical protein
MDRDLLERYLTEGLSLSEIGILVNRHPSTVGYWVKKHGLVTNGRARHAARGPITREELEPLIAAGATRKEIATRLDRSLGTISYWIAKHGLEKPVDARRNGARDAAAARLPTLELECSTHGLTTFVLEGRGYYRCRECRKQRVVDWRRRTKRTLVDEAGGACMLCGYDRCLAALEFHHLDPTTKLFGLGVSGVTRAIETLRLEAKKCVLLCSNCHAEVEAGFTKLPVELV